MRFFLFTDIFCIFKGKTARYELRNLSNHAICSGLPGSDSLYSTLFVKAGYGMFRTRSWGWSVPNKVGWVLMEAPSFVVMGIWAWKAGVEAYTPQAIFVGLFMLHYFQRSFVFPLLMKGKSRMPLAIMAMGILFNVINATLLAASFSVVHCRESTNRPHFGQILYLG